MLLIRPDVVSATVDFAPTLCRAYRKCHERQSSRREVLPVRHIGNVVGSYVDVICATCEPAKKICKMTMPGEKFKNSCREVFQKWATARKLEWSR